MRQADQRPDRTESTVASKAGRRVLQLAVAVAIATAGAASAAPTVSTDTAPALALRCPNDEGCTVSNHNQVLL